MIQEGLAPRRLSIQQRKSLSFLQSRCTILFKRDLLLLYRHHVAAFVKIQNNRHRTSFLKKCHTNDLIPKFWQLASRIMAALSRSSSSNFFGRKLITPWDSQDKTADGTRAEFTGSMPFSLIRSAIWSIRRKWYIKLRIDRKLEKLDIGQGNPLTGVKKTSDVIGPLNPWCCDPIRGTKAQASNSRQLQCNPISSRCGFSNLESQTTGEKLGDINALAHCTVKMWKQEQPRPRSENFSVEAKTESSPFRQKPWKLHNFRGNAQVSHFWKQTLWLGAQHWIRKPSLTNAQQATKVLEGAEG